jgi:hypothetical protein
MRGFDRATPIVILAVALTGATCAFPTDKSDKVLVTLEGPSQVVLRGKEMSIQARAWRVIGSDTQPITNVAFAFGTGSSTTATVQHDSGGYATVTGVNSGTVHITARAISFEQAPEGDLLLRVSNPLEVDSVRPTLVRFGDTITVYGVGVDSIFIAFLDNATQFDYPLPGILPTRTRDSLGFSTATFWVTPPAHSDKLSFIGPGVFGNAPDTTKVIPIDVLEPNEAAPRTVNLEGPPLIPAIPQIKFLNPALAFEPTKRDSLGVDWYRFTQTTTRDLTIILSAPELRGTFSTFLSDSLVFVPGTPPSYAIGPTAWTLGPGSHDCKGFAFEPPETQPESTIVALRGMPPGRLHALSLYSQPGRYGLAVFEGYITSDPTVPRDAHEEDDFCDAADARGLAVTVPGGTFRDTLTIDNPHDIDWIRFRVTSLTSVTIKMASVTSAATVDSSDVDLFLLTVPGGGASSTLDLLNRSDAAGSTETMTTLLSAGDYYLVAVDYQGVPVAYDVCISAIGGGCATFPSGPATSSALSASVQRPHKRPPASRALRINVP